jgi:hypothetical protein
MLSNALRWFYLLCLYAALGQRECQTFAGDITPTSNFSVVRVEYDENIGVITLLSVKNKPTLTYSFVHTSANVLTSTTQSDTWVISLKAANVDAVAAVGADSPSDYAAASTKSMAISIAMLTFIAACLRPSIRTVALSCVIVVCLGFAFAQCSFTAELNLALPDGFVETANGVFTRTKAVCTPLPNCAESLDTCQLAGDATKLACKIAEKGFFLPPSGGVLGSLLFLLCSSSSCCLDEYS